MEKFLTTWVTNATLLYHNENMSKFGRNEGNKYCG